MVAGRRELEILIKPDGTVHIETHGVKGKECVDMVQFLEQALGGKPERKPKPEYYEGSTHITNTAKTERRW